MDNIGEILMITRGDYGMIMDNRIFHIWWFAYTWGYPDNTLECAKIADDAKIEQFHEEGGGYYEDNGD
jgi:hypothetical protein